MPGAASSTCKPAIYNVGASFVAPRSLKQRFIRGSSWTLAGYGLSQVVRLGSSLILTRLLAPDIYGVMAIGYMVATGLVMFSDVGLAPAPSRAGAAKTRPT